MTSPQNNDTVDDEELNKLVSLTPPAIVRHQTEQLPALDTVDDGAAPDNNHDKVNDDASHIVESAPVSEVDDAGIHMADNAEKKILHSLEIDESINTSRTEDELEHDEVEEGSLLLSRHTGSNIKNSSMENDGADNKQHLHKLSSSFFAHVFSRIRSFFVVVFQGEKSSFQRVGNMTIFAPVIWQRSGWGMMGPHWFGPLVVESIIMFAGIFLTHTSWKTIGPITTVVCVILTLLSSFHLINTAYRDPGVVTTSRYHHLDTQSPPSSPAANRSGRRHSRWCELCETMQPPDGAHCLDCGVCIAGYDHHCVWMGTCIGKDNLKPFVRFNLTWLGFLLYAIFWVSLVGPRL